MSRVRSTGYSTSIFTLLFAAVLLLLVFAKALLIPLAFALNLAFLLEPAIELMERRGIRRALAVAIMTALASVCVVMGAYVLSRQVLSVAQTLPDYRANIQRKIESLHSVSERRLEDAASMIADIGQNLAPGAAPATGDAIKVQVVNQRSDQLQANLKFIGSLLEPIGELGIVVIFSVYMLMNRENLRDRLLLLAGMGNISVMTQALGDAGTRISRFLVMQLRVNACYGLVFGAGLYFLHVPEATLWGAMAATLRIVPFVGTLASLVPPLLLSIAVSSNWWSPLLVLGLFLVLETTVANVIEPWLFSSRTGISSLALLISAIFWSMLWGWPGLVLSTPLTVCLVVLGRRVPQLSFLHNLLGTNATLSPAARVYERLLSMDQAKARSVAEEYLDDKPLSDLYEFVVLPVLRLGEEDRYKGAISEVQWNFVLLSVADMVARLSEYQSPESGEQASERSRLIEARRALLRKEFAVVCISTGDRADELATAMLTQLLERAGYQTILLTAEAVSEEVLRHMAAEKATVFVLSAMPLFAFAQMRALCQRVKGQLPQNRVVVALWNSDEDADDLLARFGAARPELVVSTLKQAIAHIEVWRRATKKD